jgi:hypothetical protein
MFSLPMSIECSLGIERRHASWLRTLVRWQALMFFSHMFVERFLLSEALTAILTAESVGSFVD